MERLKLGRYPSLRNSSSSLIVRARLTGRCRGRRWIRHPVMIGQEVAGLAVGRRARTLREHGLIPGGPVILEPVEDILVSVPQVCPFTRVLNDVEQELVAGDLEIFPVAIADGTL